MWMTFFSQSMQFAAVSRETPFVAVVPAQFMSGPPGILPIPLMATPGLGSRFDFRDKLIYN